MILLVNPPLGTRGGNVFYPNGLLSILAVLKSHEFQVDLLDLEHLTYSGSIKLNSDDFFVNAAKQILSFKPDIVGFGTLSTNYHLVIQLSKVVKQLSPKIKIIIGGPQASALPRETIKHFFNIIDVVVVGEGEKTVIDILNSDFSVEKLEKIRGIAFHDGSDVKVNEPVVLISDLDSLPYEDLSLGLLDKYKNIPFFSYSLEVGRGCLLNCSFCSTAPMWQRKDRRKSPERIFNEMKRLSAKGIDAFALTHDNFTASKKFMHELCDHLISNNSPYRWTVSSRGDVLSYEELLLLRKAGCFGMFIGTESGSLHMQKVFNKNLDLKKTESTIKMCAELGIKVSSKLLLGHPEETRTDADETLMMALKIAAIPLTIISVTELCPLPNTTDCRKYRDELFYSNNTCDVARRPFKFKETEEMIFKYPEIFSVFLSFPCSYMDDDTLALLMEFYGMILAHFPKLVYQALNKENIVPIQFFEIWLKWKEFEHPETVFERSWIKQTFPDFFRKTFIN